MTKSIAEHYRRQRGLPRMVVEMTLGKQLKCIEKTDRYMPDGRVVFCLVFVRYGTKCSKEYLSREMRDTEFAELRREMERAEDERQRIDHGPGEGVAGKIGSIANQLLRD